MKQEATAGWERQGWTGYRYGEARREFPPIRTAKSFASRGTQVGTFPLHAQGLMHGLAEVQALGGDPGEQNSAAPVAGGERIVSPVTR
jgi:hypothetical protein